MMRFVLSVRVGIGWDTVGLQFEGPVSLIPAAASHTATAVLYLSGRPFFNTEMVAEWRAPSGVIWHRGSFHVEPGTPMAWSRCGRGPLQPGRWHLELSWRSTTVHPTLSAAPPSGVPWS